MNKGTAEKAGWVTRKLGAVTAKIGSGTTPLGGEEAYKETGICLIRSLNVHDWGFKEAKLAQGVASSAPLEPKELTCTFR
jgi:type I restriction enzyme S subunit